jgi:hypothetical protein
MTLTTSINFDRTYYLNLLFSLILSTTVNYVNLLTLGSCYSVDDKAQRHHVDREDEFVLGRIFLPLWDPERIRSDWNQLSKEKLS